MEPVSYPDTIEVEMIKQESRLNVAFEKFCCLFMSQDREQRTEKMIEEETWLDTKHS